MLLDLRSGICTIEEERMSELDLCRVYDFDTTAPLDGFELFWRAVASVWAAAERSFDGHYGHE